MGRTRLYDTDAERQRAFRERRKQERQELLAQAEQPRRHERHEHDHYVTPIGAIRAALRLVESQPERLLDPCAGNDARWAREAKRRWPAAIAAAVELRDVPRPPGVDLWYAPVDFLEAAPSLAGCFDLVLANPPYAQAEAFVRAGLDCLRDGGELICLLRTSFREGKARNGPGGLFAEFSLRQQAVCIERLRFYDRASGMTSMSFFVWEKGWRGETRLTSISIEDENEADP